MQAAQAASLLESMTYKPDSRISAWPMSLHEVAFELEFASHDSTPRPDGSHAPGEFISPPVVIDVRELDGPEDVMGAGLLAVEAVEKHEAREFWRVRHGIAPFHPHNRSGEAAWRRIQKLRRAVHVLYPEPAGR